MISTTTTNYDKGGKDDPIELEHMDVEDQSTANATDSQVDQQMDIDSGSESEVEEIEMKETEMTVDMQNQKPGVDKVPAKLKEIDEIVSEAKTVDEVEEIALQGESPKPKKLRGIGMEALNQT